jgi:hypothetical protein
MRALIGIALVILPFLGPGSAQGGSDRKVHPNA